MAGVKAYIRDEVKFRRLAMAVYGYGRGSLSKAAEKAFERWGAKHEALLKEIDVPEDPVKAIARMLKGLKKLVWSSSMKIGRLEQKRPNVSRYLSDSNIFLEVELERERANAAKDLEISNRRTRGDDNRLQRWHDRDHHGKLQKGLEWNKDLPSFQACLDTKGSTFTSVP